MYERFTDRARKVMMLANQEAQRFNHEYLGTEHLLLGLVKEGSGIAANVLRNLGVELDRIRLEVEKIVQAGPADTPTMGKLPRTPRAKRVIEYAIEEAKGLNHNYVGTEHLLLGLIRENEGVAAQILLNLGVTVAAVRTEILHLLGKVDEKKVAEIVEEVRRDAAKTSPPEMIQQVVEKLRRDADYNRKEAEHVAREAREKKEKAEAMVAYATRCEEAAAWIAAATTMLTVHRWAADLAVEREGNQ